MDFPGGSDGKESCCNVGDMGSILGLEDPLEEGMAIYSSVLAWRIPWTEEIPFVNNGNGNITLKRIWGNPVP